MHAASRLAAALLSAAVASSSAFLTPNTSSRTLTLAPLRSAVADDSTKAAVLVPVVPERESKYPTARGQTVDSRKVVNDQDDDNLLALRLSHILFASTDLAKIGLDALNKAEWSFAELAGRVSNCAETRKDGGTVGWVSVEELRRIKQQAAAELDGTIAATADHTPNPNEHLDLILPPDARRAVLETSTKPGDVILVESKARGVHLVQIADVMVDVRKLSSVRVRGNHKTRSKLTYEKKKAPASAAEEDKEDGPPIAIEVSANKQNKLRGVLGGALLDDAGQPKQTDLTYKIETMGCQMNVADSERIEGQLLSLGIRPLREEEEKAKKKRDRKKPDVVVLNTCSIRDHAEQKVYSYIGPYAKRKREGEDVTIIVAGCVAQQEGENLLRRCPEVDLVMGPQYANRIADLLEDVSYGNQVVATEAAHVMEDSTKPRRGSAVCGWVNIIYGCNERCTYCIVPTTRGVEQSRPAESIVEEVEELVGRGYKEVTLLGQNIDAYGRDMIPKRKFSDLLRTVGSVPGLDRLRFVTSHPRYMSLGVVDAVADTPAACEYFHIPFQSGSNDILKAMGRGHTREKFLQIVDRIRQRLPDASITADVIVGFPGETEQDFLDTLSLMKEVVFCNVNTAAYSPRPNTPAAVWENQLTDEVKQDRLRRINVLNLEHASERRARMMGRTVEVLVEERNVKVPTQVMGRTTHGYIVYLDGDIDELRGTLVDVEIDTCQTYYLSGKAVETVRP